MSITATYRLQLHRGFGFADAEAQVPYLAALGVSHLYLSPILQAVAGSQHGYDVVDHTGVSADLGGEAGLISLSDTAHAHGLGLVVDIVPNHMALVAPEHANAPLWSVLAEGREASTAPWFDIDWEAGGGRLGLPILGDTLERTLAAGELRLESYDGAPVIRYHEHVLPVADGTEGDDVAEVLDRQHYTLASWREKERVLNYRRFFDADQLIAVRVERPDVFEATHRTVLDLNHRGVIDGFRIDHPDGLADPQGYLQQLAESVRPGTVVWVEKILEGDEALPSAWRCAGTTGYDAIQAVQTALVDPASAAVLDRTWQAVGGEPSVEVAVHDAKRQVVEDLLAPEVARLTRRAGEALPAEDPARLRAAVVGLLVSGEVYRAYVGGHEPLSPLARSRIDRALATAVAAEPGLRAELELLAGLARCEDGGAAAVDFAVRLQQTWGPVMAKGIEDTAFYRWHRLVALNEVGGNPGTVADAGPGALHAWARRQQTDWPGGMTTLSTHDTKRSEDVRARLLAFAGDAAGWERCSGAFRDAADAAGLDGPTAHLIWQTLVGVGEISEERLHGYLLKAVREAKQRTAWVDGDVDYESAVLAFADLAQRGPLRQVLDEAIDANRPAARAMVLAAKLLQLMLPGVPDVYQGSEIVSLSLVDPDNRRAVDFPERAERLRLLDEGEAPRDLDDEKLLVTSRVLRLRRRRPDWFGEGADYASLVSTSEHAVGFVRAGQVACVVTRAPHRLLESGGWTDATVTLPPGRWTDLLTGGTHPGGDLACAELFSGLPVALLVSEAVGEAAEVGPAARLGR